MVRNLTGNDVTYREMMMKTSHGTLLRYFLKNVIFLRLWYKKMRDECMVIIKKSALNTFGAKYPDAIPALNEWYAKVKAADWRNHADLKTTFLSADYIANERYRL